MAPMIEALIAIPTQSQYLLLVLIFPPDSINESSNIAYLWLTKTFATTYRHRDNGDLFPEFRFFFSFQAVFALRAKRRAHPCITNLIRCESVKPWIGGPPAGPRFFPA